MYQLNFETFTSKSNWNPSGGFILKIITSIPTVYSVNSTLLMKSTHIRFDAFFFYDFQIKLIKYLNEFAYENVRVKIKQL